MVEYNPEVARKIHEIVGNVGFAPLDRVRIVVGDVTQEGFLADANRFKLALTDRIPDGELVVTKRTELVYHEQDYGAGITVENITTGRKQTHTLPERPMAKPFTGVSFSPIGPGYRVGGRFFDRDGMIADD